MQVTAPADLCPIEFKIMKQTVLITGTSSGFGRETAKFFQQKGWNVIATMRSPEKEQELNLLENMLVTALDVQKPETIAEAVSAGIQKFGNISALVNNAGYGLMGVFESANQEQIRKQFEVNVFGMMAVTQEVLPHFRKNGEGAIVNLSTFGGVTGLPFTSLYASSKFAVEGWSEALSHELFKLNIGVKIIEPGGVHTNFRGGLDVIVNEIADYNALQAQFFSRYAKPTEHLPKASATDVANVIFTAATDKSSKLRYVVGEDAQLYIDAKQKHTEEELVQTIRDYFIN
jgi:NAD(P)-dependent dehydrogenase (short-subunit alcohol dehydrogenase family)